MEIVAAFIFIVIVGHRYLSPPMNDSTDRNGKRSNLIVRVDGKTGLEYLEAEWGGLTPRLDVDGKHMSAPPDAGKEE